METGLSNTRTMFSPQTAARVACLGLFAFAASCGFARVGYDQSGNGTSGSGGSGGRVQATNAPAYCNADTGRAQEVRVCSGDTLIALGRRENVTVRGLMRANGLSDDKIQIGQVLTIPNESTHVVQPGDQVSALSRQYGVPVEDIVAANELNRPYIIIPEQRLAIPRGGNWSVGNGALVAAVPSQPTVNTAPANNAPANDPNVTIGSGAPVAEPTQTTPSQAAPPSQAGTSKAPPVAVATGTGAPVAAGPVPRVRPAGQSKAAMFIAEKPKSSPAKPARSTPKPGVSGGFLLPVQGRIVSDFGPKSGGLHNDGINIAAPRGTPIQATEAGTIAYAGDGLPGFGNLILIRHPDGWTSAYAHADTVAVKRGEAVSRGQTIGQVGSTGSVKEPQLHFELRKHDKAVNPKPLLGT
jgi:murein DD-endopeptidase MepM/ murein hydrolase activator NlpD